MRTWLAVLFSLLALAGCGGDDSTSPDTSHVGTYQLRTVGGSNLPATLAQEGDRRLEITGGSLSLVADRTFNYSADYRISTGTAVTTDSGRGSGTYRRNSDAIVLRYGDGSEEHGSLSGNTLTLTADGIVLVFER